MTPEIETRELQNASLGAIPTALTGPAYCSYIVLKLMIMMFVCFLLFFFVVFLWGGGVIRKNILKDQQ